MPHIGTDAAFGQRDIQQLRAGLRVLEKHLVKIPQPEQQQRVLWQFAFDAAILRHHGRELGFAGHFLQSIPAPHTGEANSNRRQLTN